MKKLIGIAAILLIWAGSATGGVLKVKVPVDELEQMKSRLETLEKKNQELKSEIRTLSQTTTNAEMNERLARMARENEGLQRELNILAEKTTDAKMNEQLEKMARENEELQKQVAALTENPSQEASLTEKKDSRIDALGRENRQLKRTVTSLKESGTVQRSDRRTARQVYFEANKKFASHSYK
ncbi:MAG: hypothetical protein ABR523_06145 [Desulfurivibrionaceae bacterium]